ncbi:MAG TPA: hypothetical protein VEL73_01005 [Mycobacteriales bacterium]|nr:hypothetical protein [Mycobacteriales bacterium]
MTRPAPPSALVGVDPAAPRPALGFRLDVPDEYTVLDLDPATSDASLERLLDERGAAVVGAARQRVRGRQVLRQVVADHRKAGVFLAAYLAGAGASPGEIVGAGLTLAWRRFAGGVDLDALAAFFQENDPQPGEDRAPTDVLRVRLPCGEAVRVVNRQLAPVPLTSRGREVVVVQHLVPVPQPASDWLAVLTASTPDVEGARDFIDFAGRVVWTLEFLDGEGRPVSEAGRAGTGQPSVTTSTATARRATS